MKAREKAKANAYLQKPKFTNPLTPATWGACGMCIQYPLEDTSNYNKIHAKTTTTTTKHHSVSAGLLGR